MKKIIATMVFMLMAVASWAYVEVGGIYYNLASKTKTAEVTRGSTQYSGAVSIPTSVVYDGITYSVTSIEESAFEGCSSLTSVTIPNSVNSIRHFTFRNCSSLTSVTIPNSVNSIGYFAFKCCTSLTSIIIPNSVTSIEEATFEGCSSLTSVTIPNSVTNIGDFAFADCSSLTSITIPNSVTIIEESAFEGCSDLVSITIPNSVTEIGWGAFCGCKNLETVTCYAIKIPSTREDVFKDAMVEYATLIVPEESLELYKSTSPWSEFGTFKTIEGGEPEIKKCSMPTISYANGELVYSVETEGADVISKIECTDIKTSYDLRVPLSATYNITAYATKVGYEDSDKATATLVWATATLTNDATEIKAINIEATPLLVSQNSGQLTVSGLQDGEIITVYNIDGRKMASSKVFDNSATFGLSELLGKVIVMKVGDKSAKVMVK